MEGPSYWMSKQIDSSIFHKGWFCIPGISLRPALSWISIFSEPSYWGKSWFMMWPNIWTQPKSRHYLLWLCRTWRYLECLSSTTWTKVLGNVACFHKGISTLNLGSKFCQRQMYNMIIFKNIFNIFSLIFLLGQRCHRLYAALQISQGRQHNTHLAWEQ